MRQINDNYARALAELSVPRDDLERAVELLKKNPELMQVLKNPLVSMAKKERIIDRVFPESVRNFLKVACLHERTGQIEEIFECYEEYFMRRQGIAGAVLICVTPPTKEQLQRMKEFLCGRFKKNDVTIDIQRDPSLLGGFILKAFDTEYDYSLKGRMERLRQQLTGGERSGLYQFR